MYLLMGPVCGGGQLNQGAGKSLFDCASRGSGWWSENTKLSGGAQFRVCHLKRPWKTINMYSRVRYISW